MLIDLERCGKRLTCTCSMPGLGAHQLVTVGAFGRRGVFLPYAHIMYPFKFEL